MRASSVKQLHSLEIDIGTTGPHAGAGDVQTWFHREVSHGRVPHGWGNQVSGEPSLEMIYQWRRRLAVYNPSCNGICIDAIPAWGVAVGTVQDFAHVGGIARIGLNVSSDWPGQIPVGLADYQKHRPHAFEVYAYVGADGRAVMHNFSLDGNVFGGVDISKTYGINRNVWVGDALWGAAIRVLGMTLAYRGVIRSREFHPNDSVHRFGSPTLTLSSYGVF